MNTRPLHRLILITLLTAPFFCGCATSNGDVSSWGWINARASAKSRILSLSTTAIGAGSLSETDEDQGRLDLFREREDLQRKVRISISDGNRAWDSDDQYTLRDVVKELEMLKSRCSDLASRISAYKPGGN